MHFDLISRPKIRRTAAWSPVCSSPSRRLQVRTASFRKPTAHQPAPHQPRSTQVRKVVVSAILLLAFVATAWACSVPVFRYALERWPADAYHAVIFHRGPLTTEQQTLADQFTEKGLAARIASNVELHLVDLDNDPGAEWVGLWNAQKTETLPWLAVMYPPVSSAPVALTAGPLEEMPVDKILDSPIRREVAKRLIAGESAVWILLEIGDKAKDDAAEALLKNRIKHLMETLELPEIEEADIASGLVSVPQEELKVGFSILRLSRNDPKEEYLTRMLLGTEEDLKNLKHPMAFPIFGRGRALYALVGKGINNETIDEAGAFLTGACSCQVKELNPGVDLLISADWDNLVKTSLNSDRELPELSGLIGFQEKPAEPTNAVPPVATVEATEPEVASETETELTWEEVSDPLPPDPSEEGGASITWGVIAFGGIAVLIVGGASVLLLLRRTG